MDISPRVSRAALLITAILLAGTAPAYSRDMGIGFSTFLDAGWVFPAGLTFHPGAEVTFYSFDPEGYLVLTLGADITGQVAFAKWLDLNNEDLWSYTTFGLAVAPAAVFSFDDGEEETNRFIERVAFSLSPGVGINYYIYAGDPAYYTNRETFEIGFAGIAGCRFSLTRFISLRLDAMYWGQYIGANIAAGIQLDLW